jgi:hypothetical protein
MPVTASVAPGPDVIKATPTLPEARVAFGHVHRALLVSDEVVCDAFAVAPKLVVDVQHRAARITEDRVHTLVQQGLDYNLRAPRQTLARARGKPFGVVGLVALMGCSAIMFKGYLFAGGAGIPARLNVLRARFKLSAMFNLEIQRIASSRRTALMVGRMPSVPARMRALL